MENQYNKGHAKEILEPCGLLGDCLKIKKSGVWPAFKRGKLMKAETEGLRWRPTRQMQRIPSAPEVKKTPMLPNPFNARELAAFMLAGTGARVADFYGDWSDGPDPDSLDDIDPDSNARRAVIEAFAAYRLAIEKVGQWDADALARRDAAGKAHWGSGNDKALLKAFDDAQAEWDAAHQAWLTAMVVCLLETKPQAATEAPAAQTAATPAPLVAKGNTQAWTVSKPQRGGAYRTPLYRLIAAAYRDGGPRPTARDVVEAWRINKPAEVAQVLPDGFDYYDAQGNTKHADLEAVRKAIDRMTSTR